MTETLSALYKRLAADARESAGSYGSKAAGLLYAHEILSIHGLGEHPATRQVESFAAMFAEFAQKSADECFKLEDHLRKEGATLARLDRDMALASGFQEGESSFQDSAPEGSRER